jgi:serine/threonine protein kinase
VNPERWRRIEELYHAALLRTEGERVPFLAQACGGDAALRREVESLLARAASTGRVADDLALTSAPSVDGASAPVSTRWRLGVYELQTRLGAGGMGVVYRAIDTKLNRPVAIKFLSEQLADPAARRRFQREAQTASSLNHPHIVTVHDAGEFDGRQYLVTEFVDGGTLREWMAEARRPWLQVVELLIGVADGLAAAHHAGILHRDIKPANILIAKNGYAKLADFGLAKLQDENVQRDTKLLPDGQAVQLTNDSLEKMGPAFSPDGARIAYTVVDATGFSSHETWIVSPLGGQQPQRLLTNAEGLTWIRTPATSSASVLFSVMTHVGAQMSIVSANESRGDLRSFTSHDRQTAWPTNLTRHLTESGCCSQRWTSDRGSPADYSPSTGSRREHVWARCRRSALMPRGLQTARGCTSPPRRQMAFTSGVNASPTENPNRSRRVWRQRRELRLPPTDVVSSRRSGRARAPSTAGHRLDSSSCELVTRRQVRLLQIQWFNLCRSSSGRRHAAACARGRVPFEGGRRGSYGRSSDLGS